MRERRMSLLLMLIAGGVLILTLGCAGTGLAVRAGLAPALDLQIPTGAYRMLLIHNGPSFYCAPYGLHDNCRRRVRYEFYCPLHHPDDRPGADLGADHEAVAVCSRQEPTLLPTAYCRAQPSGRVQP